MDIYILKNFSLQETFFGLAEGKLQDTVTSHKNDPDSPVGHWKFDSEEIKWGLVQEDMHEANAHAFLQALRREPQDDGWVLVVGGD